ncbi:MAG: chloride channel protein [Actinomycetota bacterium]
METSVRRVALLCVLATGLGLLGGGAAWVLLRLISLLTNLALLHRVAWTLPSLAQLRPSAWTVVAAACGGLAVSLLAKWSPVIRGHGIPEAMEAVLTKQSRISPRAAIAKPLSAAIAIGTGGPFGAEGPIIVTGGAIGSLIGQVLPVSPSERKVLLAAGAAAGMAATFGTPLAAVILALELLLFEFSTRAFIPLVVSAAVAAGVHSAIFGAGPLFAVPSHDYAGLDKLPFFAILGLACGLLSAVVTKGLFAVERGYRALPVPEFWHPVIGGIGFGLIGLLEPRALGVGYDVIGEVLSGRFALEALVVVAVAKLFAWWIALGSGTSGGTLAPLLLIGGSFGGVAGILAERVAPGLHLTPGAVAVVAMAAVFGASTRATFASIVFLFELTGDYSVILPLMVASVLATLVTSAITTDSLMTEKLRRRGLRVHTDYEVDVLRTTSVRDVMTTDVQSLAPDVTVEEARRRFIGGGHGAYPIVGRDGSLLGIVSRGDLLRAADARDGVRPLREVASPDVVTVAPDDDLLTALRSMLDEEVEHLPVIADGRVVGICTRTDILAARRRQFEHERPQFGWRRAARRTASADDGPVAGSDRSDEVDAEAGS